MRDLPNLDFIRALAVVSVVLEHTLMAYGIFTFHGIQVPWIGVVGVFIFFVHTCLVLMWSLERRPHTLDFYVRRAFRIYPLAIVAIAIIVAFHIPVTGGPAGFFGYVPPPSNKALLSALALSQNLFGQHYLPMGVLWSLPYEVQMYLALPMIFFFVQKNFSLMPLLVFWAFIVLACRAMFPNEPHNIFLCIPYFLPGVMAYVGFGRYKSFLPSWTLLPSVLALWIAFLTHPSWRRADVLCLVLGLSLPLFHQIKAGWVKRASHQIAKYSYGVYLAHPFALVIVFYLIPHRPVAVQIAVLIAAIVAFSVSAYYLLEHPMIRVGSRLAALASERVAQRQLSQFRIPEAEIN